MYKRYQHTHRTFQQLQLNKMLKFSYIYPNHVAEVPADQTLYLLLLQTDLGAEQKREYDTCYGYKLSE